MSKIGYGYGSEWHLLRFLGYHRDYLNQEIEDVIGMGTIKWLDFPFSGLNERFKRDEEYKGLNFLDDNQYEHILSKWKEYWPTTGNQQNWDAIGKAGSDDTWILVEAKANLEECESSTQAKPATENGGRDKIIEAFKDPIKLLTGSTDTDPEIWLNKYYQYANRLAVLHFLNENKIKANLLFIYFIGDDNTSGTCPKSKDAWETKVQDIHEHLRIDEKSPLMKQVKHLYLPIIKNYS
ncbi:MAG: hypothetical protein WDZ80_08075 [Candidatus Paceibacterota bacterium]